MADQTVDIDIRAAQMWPQGDARDPLGIWAARGSIADDGLGGQKTASIGLPQTRRAGNIFTCYAVTLAAAVTSDDGLQNAFCRLLTNWPPADSPGVQGFSTNRGTILSPSPEPVPKGQFRETLFDPQYRYLLLFDPRAGAAGRINLVELSYLTVAGTAKTLSFEASGYWWDRSVLDAPGGPRHPG